MNPDSAGISAVLLILLFCAAVIHAGEKADITVAADGSGMFRTIMEAIKSVPADNDEYVVILVKNGTYNEHVFIDRSFIAIVGEDREETVITFSINRDEWSGSHSGKNNGSGVIDIGASSVDGVSHATVTDVVIANLTVENTYNSTGVKTHVIRGESGCNRISVINCNVRCKGHDTVALWNVSGGMYYHANCSFTGSIDAVCPRGWCYAVGCDFYEMTSSSPLWHEIGAGSTAKFVIRNGSFRVAEGNSSNFRLLNSNNSSDLGTRFFLLDCMISAKATTKGNYTEAYFYNCHGEESDQSWYSDNLSSASGSPEQEQIDASWCFDEKWDPENSLPPILPFASLPQPWDKAYNVASDVTLEWINGRNATVSDLYFGTENPPPFREALTQRTCSPGKLPSGTYYWRIDAIDGVDTVKGPVWSFSTVPGVSTGEVSRTVSKDGFFIMQQRERAVRVTQFNGNNKQMQFSINDLLGRRVPFMKQIQRDENMNTLNSTNIPSGLYLTSWRCGAQSGNGKMILP